MHRPLPELYSNFYQLTRQFSTALSWTAAEGRKSRHQRRPGGPLSAKIEPMLRAAIDVGSNSVLLCVQQQTPDGWAPVLETSHITALGAGTRTSGRLSEASISRTLAALHSSWQQAEGMGAAVRAAATMAVRMAGNAAEFLDRAAAQGTPVRVLSGGEEAELGLMAVCAEPKFAGLDAPAVVDIGGQSTELSVAGPGCRPAFSHSYPIGALGLRDDFLGESPAMAERLAALAQIDQVLGREAIPRPEGPVIAMGATPTNLVSLRRGRDFDPVASSGEELSFEEVSRFVDRLCGLDDASRAALPGIERGRERTLHAGALILERALHALRAEGCLVSSRGWRHALWDLPA